MQLKNLKPNSEYVINDMSKKKNDMFKTCNVRFLYSDDEYSYFNLIKMLSCKKYIMSNLSADIIVENTDTHINIKKLK